MIGPKGLEVLKIGARQNGRVRPMKIEQALKIAGRARVRRYIPGEEIITEASSALPQSPASPPPKRPPAVRDARGCFAKGWAGGPGRPKGQGGGRDDLREALTSDLFHVLRRHGKHMLQQFCEENPGGYLRLMATMVQPARREHRVIVEVLRDPTLSDSVKISRALMLLQSPNAVAPGQAVHPRYWPRRTKR
jgi:hypothetical protein